MNDTILNRNKKHKGSMKIEEVYSQLEFSKLQVCMRKMKNAKASL